MTGVAADSPMTASTSGETSALERLDGIRQQFAQGGVANAILAAAKSVSVTVPDVASSPVAVPSSTPPQLVAPVGSLLGAIQTATGLLQQAIHVTATQAEALMQRADTLMGAVTRAALAGGSGLLDPALQSQAAALQSDSAAAVDRPTLYSGALLIARTIDEWLPSLRAAAAVGAAHRAVQPASGCDIVDEPPVLCIGSGHNTYTQDYALLISEGGHDTFTNSAGGAAPGTQQLPVSIVIDLGGYNKYLSDNALTSDGQAPKTVQGGGQFGIGMLISAGGDDTYSATYNAASAPSASLFAQGVGGAGVGILDDMGGNNTFEASNTAPNDLVDVIAQGYAALGGMGIVMTGGGGTNSFLLYGRPTAFTDSQGLTHMGFAQTRGFGWAVEGAAALWSDGGGTDSMRADAFSPVVPPNTSKLAPVSMISEPIVQAFAAADAGAASTILGGPGDDTYSALGDEEGIPLGAVSVGGFGYGGVGASGAIYDAGGNNTFAATAVSHVAVNARVDDSCACGGVTATAASAGGAVGALGVGVEGGTGLVDVNGPGNNAYRNNVDVSSSASAIDNRTSASPGDTGAEAEASIAQASSSGQGFGGDGAGYLVDRSGGQGIFSSTVAQTTRATASAPNLPSEPVTAHARDTTAANWVQASSFVAADGELTDQSGSDCYCVITTTTATANPPTEEVTPAPSLIEQGGVCGGVCGGIASTARFADSSQPGSGDIDTFDDVPPDPACQGTRGSGAWVDCGTGAGTGVALVGRLGTCAPLASIPEIPVPAALLAAGGVAALGLWRARKRRRA
jgi:hypothetical protein